MRKYLFILSLLVIVPLAYSSNIVTIKCGAPSYIGKDAVVYQIDDYISYKRTQVAGSKVNSDSTFSVSFEVDQTKKVLIEIDNIIAQLYVTPGGFYDVMFPKLDETQVSKTAGGEAQLYFFDLDSNDVNYKILNFTLWIDEFMLENSSLNIVDKELFRAKFDTLMQYAYEYYKDEEDLFVRTYVTYHMAQLEQMSVSRKHGDRKIKNYARYFHKQPIQYQNDQYMIFFNNYFKNVMAGMNFKIENKVYLASIKNSPTLMKKAMSEDLRFKSDQLTELVLIKAMKQNFYTGQYAQSNILTILDSLRMFSKYPEHQKISGNIIGQLTTLEPGYPAPEIRLRSKSGEMINWKTFKGKYVYLNFFETWSETALKEMKQYPDLRDKYGADIEFVSICMDEDSSALQKFLNQHETFNWKFYHIGEQRELIKRFKVKSVPSYFLIDQEGYLVAAPALSPSPNGKYETIDKTFFYIRKALHPNQTFKVGQLDD